MYKQNLGLNNLERLICHKTQLTRLPNLWYDFCYIFHIYLLIKPFKFLWFILDYIMKIDLVPHPTRDEGFA